MILIVSTDTQVGAAFVDGQRAEVVEHKGVWSVDSPIGQPLRGAGPIVSFHAQIGPEDKYLTLAATSAGDGYADRPGRVDRPAVAGAAVSGKVKEVKGK